MKVFVWRHNKTFHSYSMINEPCVHQDFYCDAVAVVLAETMEEALELLQQKGGWRVEDLRMLEAKVYDTDKDHGSVIFSDIRA